MIRLLFSGLLTAFISQAHAAEPENSSHVRAELVAETTALLRGGDSQVALKLRPEPGWHTYWRNPGDSGLSTKLSWTLPAGVSAGPIQWPAPHRAPLGELTNYGYDDETLHLVSLAVPANWPLSRPLPLRVLAKWLVCKDVCIPGEAELGLSLPVVAGSADLDPAQADAFERARAALPEPAPAGWQARYQVADDNLSLALQAPGLEQAEVIEFFPYANDLVNHAAPQKLAVDAQGLRLSQGLSSYFLDAPARVEGVLVLAQGSQRRAYELSAGPGTVAPVLTDRAPPVAAAKDAAPGAATRSPGLLLALLFALLGGLILNLMPCVFPVLSLKALALAQNAGHARARQRASALAYTAGTVLSCVLAAGLLLALRAGGEALGWGFQLQSPTFIAALAYLMFALGLSMSGLLEIGSSWMGAGSSLASKSGLAGSFFTGVLAVVVASPCTAPFMGSALGYAVTQPVPVALLVFAALGLGLALPFLLIGYFPRLARMLPRPGAWMLTFKQAMAFPLYLTVAWLLWVLTRQAGADALGLTACGLVAVALAVWLLGRPGRKLAGTLIAALALLAAGYGLASPRLRVPAATVSAASTQEAWSPERVAALRAEGRTVFVDFTADWCITCKVNERGALASERVRQAFAEAGVVSLVADWTTNDPRITRALAEFGRNGVPLYLLYPRGGEPRVLPQVLTPQVVIDALQP